MLFFEFESLEFICYLRFVIWHLPYLRVHFVNTPCMLTKMNRIALPKLTGRQKELLALIKDRWAKLAAAAGCSAVVAAMTSASAYLVKPVVEKIFEQKDAQMLKLIPLMIIAVFFTKGVAAYGSYYLLNHVGQSVIMRLRNRLYSRFLNRMITL